MRKYLPLFVTSTARSGSYLISMLLSSNKDLMIASEPYLELFRSMRNAFFRHGAPAELRGLIPPSAPIQDYYFTDERVKLMDVVQNGSLQTPYDQNEWDEFLETSASRVDLQCAELKPLMNELRGKNYKEMFDHGFEIIAKARKAHDRKWVGIKDAWTIEFFGPLAHAYPEAKFLIILRDPRAVINSMFGVENIDPLQVAQALSYARHWRKYVAFAIHYRNSPVFKNRIHLVTHEQVLRDPEKMARQMCNFLEVEYDSRMIDTNNYFDFATGKIWEGNSSFEQKTSGISTHRGERWRSKLNPHVINLVDFVCGREMEHLGYEPSTHTEGSWPTHQIIDYLLEQEGAYTNWRTDLGDLQRDYGYELFRHAMLYATTIKMDEKLVRRSFLFEDVFFKLRDKSERLIESYNVKEG